MINSFALVNNSLLFFYYNIMWMNFLKTVQIEILTNGESQLPGRTFECNDWQLSTHKMDPVHIFEMLKTEERLMNSCLTKT
jgi:hypothetical protein